VIDALGTFLVVLGLWIAAGAALATLLTLGTAAAITWAWNAAHRHPRRASWGRGRLRARFLVRSHLRGSKSRTAPRPSASTPTRRTDERPLPLLPNPPTSAHVRLPHLLGPTPAAARRALNRRDSHAHARLRELHNQLDAGIPLAEIRVSP